MQYFIHTYMHTHAHTHTHTRIFIHTHTQPENIVLKDKDAKQLKIIDFGTAQDLKKHPDHKAMVGTPEFIGMKGNTQITSFIYVVVF